MRKGDLGMPSDLSVLMRVDKKVGKSKRVSVYKCFCGNSFVAMEYDIKSGHTRSCGCMREKHHHARKGLVTKTYSTWIGMLARCNSKSNASYRSYGGRGIKVCDRWKDFRNFLADMGQRPPRKTLDRINPYGNYEPSNCRWATDKQQAENTRAAWRKRQELSRLRADGGGRGEVV